MSVKIIIDSTADMAPEIKERFTIVPLHICFGETEYIDGVTIDHKQFYEMLIECDVIPTTSQASPDAFMSVFDEVVANGDEAVVITVASKLSGTYQSACIAASECGGKIFVIDSKSVSIGTAVLAQLALKLADEGKSAKEIAGILTAKVDDVLVVALLDTLEYLKKGGRISKTAAFAGGLLSIKPVMAVTDGEVVALGKARGSKQGNNLLVKEIEKAGGVDFSLPVILGYTGLSDHLLEKYVADSEFIWSGSEDALQRTVIGSVIGTHAGPGAIAVAFFKAGNNC